MSAPIQNLQPDKDLPAHGAKPCLGLQVFGMRRSGNHAVINWLLRNAPPNSSGTVFLNNCAPKRDPFKSHKSLEVNGVRSGGNPDALNKAGNAPMLVVSYEDFPPPSPDAENPTLRHLAPEFIDHKIIVFRGFLNWSASLLKKLRRNEKYTSVTRTAILLRAIETYGQMIGRLQKPGFVGICYDAWLHSPTYRADMLKQLGLPVTDNSLGHVQQYGGGSSFQQDATSGSELSGHLRWTQMVEDSEYLVALWTAAQDPALLQIIEPLFPDDVELLKPMIGAHPGLEGGA